MINWLYYWNKHSTCNPVLNILNQWEQCRVGDSGKSDSEVELVGFLKRFSVFLDVLSDRYCSTYWTVTRIRNIKSSWKHISDKMEMHSSGIRLVQRVTLLVLKNQSAVNSQTWLNRWQSEAAVSIKFRPVNRRLCNKHIKTDTVQYSSPRGTHGAQPTAGNLSKSQPQ